jgi:uncharacterized protein (TIGR03000 family)
MRTKKSAALVYLILALAGLIGDISPANAQLLSKWGHPVFTIGLTPYDSINQGHGNYPGGPGFIPGYGYYPGPGPSRYPWLDGPGTPFDRRQILAGEFSSPPDAGALLALSKDQPLPPGSALIIVKLPAEAELWFDGFKTSQGGSYRQFLTPPLQSANNFRYLIQARWLIHDAELSRSEEVQVTPGGTVVVNFLTTDSWTGRRLETLPHPRGDASLSY